MLEGFTLFHGNKGWQLSVKQANVDGWSVRHIKESQAKRILAEIDMSLRYEPSVGTETPKASDDKRRRMMEAVVTVAVDLLAKKRRVMIEE